MAEIRCPSIDCKYNAGNSCTADSVKFGEEYVHTLHKGYRHFWICRTHEESEEYKEFLERAKGVVNQT